MIISFVNNFNDNFILKIILIKIPEKLILKIISLKMFFFRISHPNICL